MWFRRKAAFFYSTGLAAGALLAWAVLALTAPGNPPPSLREPEGERQAKVRSSHSPRSGSSLDGSIVTRGAQRTGIIPLRSPGPDMQEDGEAPRDADASRRQRFEEFERLISQHEEEPVDRDWSAFFEGAIGANLGALAGTQGFSIEDVSCRSQTCVARISWPGFENAMSGWKNVLHHSGGVGCARQILLPDASSGPESPANRFSHQVLYSRCRDPSEVSN